MRYILCVIVGLLVSLACAGQEPVQLKSLEAQREQALKEIELTGKLLAEAEKTTQNSLNRLNLLVSQILSRKKLISVLNQEISTIDKQISESNTLIVTLEEDLEASQEKYKRSVQSLYQYKSSQDKLLFVLSAENLSQSFRRMRYLKEYSDWQEREAKSIKSKQDSIAHRKTVLENSRKEKASLLTNRETESQKLTTEEKTQKVEVDKLKKQQSALQAELRRKQREAEELDRRIDRIIHEQIEQSEQARRQEEASGVTTDRRTAEVPGGYAMNKAERQLSANFANNKGKLPYPVNGPYTVVGTFGTQQHPVEKNVRLDKPGIEIQTLPNTDACAVFNGVVTGVFESGVTYSVIVRHGNYLTVYSNLSQVYVKTNDNVTTLQSLGRIYTDTARDNTTILTFQLRKEREKVNPLPWLD